MRLAFVMALVCTSFALAACTSPNTSGSQATATATAVATSPASALPAVAAVVPAPLPSWFASISPRGEAKDGAQIRVRFTHDLVAVQALESAARQEALEHFKLEPALPGRFVLLTPRMVAFQGDAPIPHAARERVTVSAGLADLAGHTLAADYSWTFTTEPLTFSGLPGANPDGSLPARTRLPSIAIEASDAVDTDSLLAHAKLVAGDSSSGIALRLAPSPAPDPSAAPTVASDAAGPASAQTSVRYGLVAAEELKPATTYTLAIEPGVAPLLGNLATTKRYVGKLRTYGPLRLERVDFGGPGDGSRFAKGAPALVFSNPIEASSARGAVSLTPAPNATLPLLRVDENGFVALDSDALTPDTKYAVRVAATLKDRFGQTLGTDVSATLETGDLAADLWAPVGLNIFPAGMNLALDVAATNLPAKAYRAAFLTVQPQNLIAHDVSTDDGTRALLPAPSAWKPYPLGGRKNDVQQAALPIRTLLHAPLGMLAYGLTARTVRAPDANGNLAWQEPQFIGAVQLTNVGIFAQWFPAGGVVRVRQLSDGKALPGARVEVYESFAQSLRKAPPSEPPCASGTTGPGGDWVLDAAAFAACASTARTADQAPELLVIARNGADWSYVRTSSYADGYAYGLDAQGWSAGTPVFCGALLSDRTLYQPGETAKFLGVAYFERGGTLGRGRSASYAVSLHSPSGAELSLGQATSDEFGAFSLSHTFDARAETGLWTISAQGQGGERLDGSFQVAQFKPPNFKVDLKLDRDVATPGQEVVATSTSDYLFGAPVEGGTSHVSVTRARDYFSPPEWETFSFGRVWPYPENEPYLTSDVLQKDVTIDARGQASTTVAVADALPFPMRYTVSAQTTDVSRLAVADTKSFLALPGPEAIGLRGDFVALAGAPFSLDAVVVDAHGKALSGRRLVVDLQRRLDSSVTQIVEGSETAHAAVRYVSVEKQDVSSQLTAQRVRLTAPVPGEYRVRANFAGAPTENAATDRSLWVAGSGEAAWLAPATDVLTVKLDKTTYRPGETATALIESPFAEAELDFAVIRHGVAFSSTRLVHGAAPQVTFTVTPDMLPNAVVEALLVRRGAALARGVPAGLKSLARLGFTPFDVALDARYLKVDVRPLHATLEPAARQHLALHLSDRKGQPVRGEFAVAVVNDAILQLSGYRFPDLVKSVYAEQPISTRFADNRSAVKLENQQRPVEKGFGFGGGVMAGPAGTRVRRAFIPLAYWNAALKTDAGGNASADFALPDDLTTWRVMALALTTDARFGNGEATFISTKPLVTNPIAPQFARPGDRFSAGESLNAAANLRGTLTIAGTLGGAARFAKGNPRLVLQPNPGALGGTQAYRFEAIADAGGEANFGFRTSLGSAEDAFSWSIPILTGDVLESVVTTGTTSARASVPLAVAAALEGPLGGLDVTLASTLLAGTLEPQQSLARPADPFATTLAGRIAIAGDALLLQRIYTPSAVAESLRAHAQEDLASLRTLALPDGGFAAWPGATRSELFTTAFALRQLAVAKAAGFDVAADLGRGARYLHKVLANPLDSGACAKGDPVCIAAARAEAIETLGTLGDARNDFVSDILAQQSAFGYYDRVKLARFLLRLPDWKKRGLALRDELFAQVALGARRATVDVRGSFGAGEVPGQAQMLGLAIASGTPSEDVDRLLNSLLALRHNGLWGCTCDDAEALNAIVLYAQQNATPPAFEAVVELPAVPPRTERADFHGYARTSQTFGVPMNSLKRGASVVGLSKTGSGTLHYVVALRYRIPNESPGAYAGLRIDRILRSATASAPLATFGLPLPAAPLTLAAGRVYDIEDRIVSDHPVDDVAILDPLPAGFEAVDQSFRTAVPAAFGGGDNWVVDYQAIYRDRVLSFVHHLEPGSYAIHYLVRSVTAGTFAWPGARVSLQYAPEEFGRTAAAQITISPE